MQKFNILYFDGSVLEHSAEVQAIDVLDAIDQASCKPKHLRVEIWLGNRRVAELGLPHA
jgi:prepilin-type processing-associated H-X9-DG protein